MSFLKLFLLGTIAGTGIAIVRLFFSWCVSPYGEHDQHAHLDDEQDESSLEARCDHTDERLATYGTFDSVSVLPSGVGAQERGKHLVEEQEGSHDPKILAGGEILSTNESPRLNAPSSPQCREQSEEKADLCPICGNKETLDGSALSYHSTQEEGTNGIDDQMTNAEPVYDLLHLVAATDGPGEETYRTFPATKLTIPGSRVPFPISFEPVLKGLLANSPHFHTDAATDARPGADAVLLMPERPKIKYFSGSEKSNFDFPRIPLITKPPIKSPAVWPHENKRRKEYAAATPATAHKASSSEGFKVSILPVDPSKVSQDLAMDHPVQTASPAPRTFKRVTNEELAKRFDLPFIPILQVTNGLVSKKFDSPKDEKNSHEPAKDPRSLDFTPGPLFRSPQEFGLVSAPGAVTAMSENRKADKEGGKLDALNHPPLKLVSLYLNPRQYSIRKASKEGGSLEKVEKMLAFTQLPQKGLSYSKSCLVSARFPIPQTLDFTSDKHSRSPNPFAFGEISNTQVPHIPSSTSETSQGVTLLSPVTRPLSSENILPDGKLIATRNIFLFAGLQASAQYSYAGQQILGPVAQKEEASIPNTHGFFTSHAEKLNATPKPEILDFTPDDSFRKPRHFPQALHVFKRTTENRPNLAKVFEDLVTEDTDILDSKRRVLQNGSVKTPLVGRVKLVSKFAGKDPRFTYATWARAGSKRGRGTHNCQEKGGCRVCD